MKFLKLIFLFLFSLTFFIYIYSQEEWEEETIERLYEEEETIGILPTRILDLNTASTEELVTIPGITPAIANNIVNYAIYKGFNSVEELKNVRGMTDKLYEEVKQYFTVKPKPPEKVLTTKLTLKFVTRTPPEEYNLEKNFSEPYYFYTKTEFNYRDISEFGFIFRQGDPSPVGKEGVKTIQWNTDNMFRYNLSSWWLTLKNFAGIDRLVGGSFILNFGQGLVFYKKPEEAEAFLFTESKVKPTGIEVFKTIRKNAGFNGIAIEKSINKFTLYGFFSKKNLSAYWINPDGSIANVLEGWESGAGNPIENIRGTINDDLDLYSWDRLESNLFGGRITTNIGRTVIGLTGFTNYYTPEINPPKTSSGYHLFRGRKNTVWGIDFDTKINLVNIFGEYAKSENDSQDRSQFKGDAFVLGFMTSFYPITFLNKFFYYSPNYHNEYSGGQTFDYAPDMNQQGVVFETEYKHSKGKAKINYILGYYPWINQKYKLFTAPHSGSNLYFETDYRISDRITLYFRQINTYKKDKIYIYSSPVYSSIYKDMDENKYKTRLQCTLFLRKGVNLRFRYDRIILDTYTYDYNTTIFYRKFDTANLVFGEVKTLLTPNLSLEGRVTLFNDTGTNGCYISQTEPYWDKMNFSWSPRFDYGIKEAAKYYLILRQHLGKNTFLWIKYANLFNFAPQRSEIPTSNEHIQDRIKENPQEVRIQYEVQF